MAYRRSFIRNTTLATAGVGLASSMPMAMNSCAGANTARVCHLGNIALKTGRQLYWGADNSTFIGDENANNYLVPTYRAPWELPKI